jgi:hypothetical protein
MSNKHILSIKIERRRIAIAVFTGLEIDDMQVRYLPPERSVAETRAASFIRWMISAYEPSIAAMIFPNEIDKRRRPIALAIAEALRQEAIPIWEVQKEDLFKHFGNPPLASSRQLREIARRIWPAIGGANSAPLLEAAALGLFIQLSRQYAASD